MGGTAHDAIRPAAALVDTTLMKFGRPNWDNIPGGRQFSDCVAA